MADIVDVDQDDQVMESVNTMLLGKHLSAARADGQVQGNANDGTSAEQTDTLRQGSLAQVNILRPTLQRLQPFNFSADLSGFMAPKAVQASVFVELILQLTKFNYMFQVCFL